MPERVATTTRTGRLHGLDLLRAVASLTVFYTYLASWFRHEAGPPGVTAFLDRWLVTPAHLNEDLGFLGLAFFFLVSGFVISHAATRQTVAEFATKRVSRIFPPLAVAVLVAWALASTGFYRVTGDPEIGTGDMLANMVLVNFFREPFVPLVGVAWALIVQLASYAMVCALLPVFRREPWLVIGIEVTACAIVLSVVSSRQSLAAATVATVGAFGTAVVLGQVVWAVWSRSIPVWAGAGLGMSCWVVFLWGDHLGYGRSDDSYPVTLLVALLVMIAVLLADEHIRHSRLVSYLSSRSYSTYLVHQVVALSVLGVAANPLGRWVAGVVAVAATFAVVELIHQIVQRPARRLGDVLAVGAGRR